VTDAVITPLWRKIEKCAARYYEKGRIVVEYILKFWIYQGGERYGCIDHSC
jgi:hypothetical protein